ncbi:MAG TPA: FtsQ-type POTRA domain-containing protein [Solirubrobacteraceae bacterium]|nr:FtsQ-type POTRA domain-containing protein [Solirubrobacteraceae bacterium]
MSTATGRRTTLRLRLPRARLPRLRRRDPRRGRRRWPRPGRRTLVGVLVLAGVLTGAYFWVRQSSLVAVQQVTVTGVSGPDATAIRQTLAQTAERMTTMEIDARALRASVARYPFVRSLRVSAHLPHAVTISVFEQVPVAVVDGRVVSAHGTLLPGVSPSGHSLPTITVPGAAGGMATGTARADVYLLAAAPYPIVSRLETVGWKPGRGLTATLRNGPVIYFGDDHRLAEKWRSAILVLADPSSAGAGYIDVTDPGRPAAGVGSDTQATEPTTGAGASASGAGASAAGAGASTATAGQLPATTGQTTATTGG